MRGEAGIYKRIIDWATWDYKIACSKCRCETDIYDTKQEVIEAWNKRTSCDTCAMYFPDDGCMAGLEEGEVAE